MCHPELARRVRGGGCVEQLKDLILATSKGGLERHGLRVPALELGRPGFKSGFFHFTSGLTKRKQLNLDRPPLPHLQNKDYNDSTYLRTVERNK